MSADYAKQFLTLRETQLAALDVFCKFREICERHNLRYWLAYGTLIGAIRHKGFIPWDDDFDVYMPRPDYDQFLRLFDVQPERNMPLKAIHTKESKAAPFLITRLSDTRYQMVGEVGLDVEDMGAFIDIYPVDGLGNDEQKAKNTKEQAFDLMVRYLRASNFACNNVGCGLIKRFAKRIRSIVYGNPMTYANSQDSLLRMNSFDESDYVAVAVWGVYDVQRSMLFDRADFSSAIVVDFEGVKANVPVGYDAILRKRYGGDYMELPPKCERVSHHNYRLLIRDSFANS